MAGKEYPIIMQTESVRAILQGRKMQTRRVVKPQPAAIEAEIYADLYNHGPNWAFWLPDNRMTEPRTWRCPYGQPGDRLWVRETWCPVHFGSYEPISGMARQWECCIQYAADPAQGYHQCFDVYASKWHPSLYMPRWASRVTLEIVKVRVERVQEISEQDCVAEGLVSFQTRYELMWASRPGPHGEWWLSPRTAYQRLWDAINAKRGYGWGSNPWVWVLEFRRLEGR